MFNAVKFIQHMGLNNIFQDLKTVDKYCVEIPSKQTLKVCAYEGIKKFKHYNYNRSSQNTRLYYINFNYIFGLKGPHQVEHKNKKHLYTAYIESGSQDSNVHVVM